MTKETSRAYISKTEWAEQKFNIMGMNDCIAMWNEKADDHYFKQTAMHEMDDEKWWNYLSEYLGAWDLIHAVMNAGEDFCDADKWFFFDVDAGCVRSFSTKQELVEKIGKQFFIDRIMEQKMLICKHERTWEVLESYTMHEADWHVMTIDGATLYMNNFDGYMVLFEPSGRILKSDF